LFFVQQKISKGCPWKTEFFACVVSPKQSVDQQKAIAQQWFSSQSGSVCQGWLGPEKMKIGPKSDIGYNLSA